MSRLLRNDFKRFWCSLRPVIAAAVAILAGLIAIPICPGYQAVMAYAQAYLFLIPVAGIMTIVFVTQEQNYGILRNKVAAGFSRTAIAASWSVVLASLCIFLLVVYNLTVFLSQHMRELAVEDVMSGGTLFTNNVMTFVLMLAFVWLSMAVCVISNGYENIITVLFVFFAAAEVGVLTANAAANSNGLRRFMALIPTTHLGDDITRIPVTASSTLIGGIILGIVFAAVSVVLLHRKNLA